MKLIFLVWIFFGVIAQLLVVVVLELTKLTYHLQMALIFSFFLFLTEFYINYINPGDRMGVFLLPLIPTILTILLLSIFASLFRGLKLLLGSARFLREGFLGLSLWFLSFRIFHWKALSIGFNDYGKNKSGIVLIDLIVIETGPKNGLNLSVSYFLTILLMLLSSQPRHSIFDPIKNFKLFRNYQIIAPYFRAPSKSILSI